MNRRKRNTRGVTLAELCIVMAVIAIVSTMVVSFTVLMQARTRVIAADRDTVSDLGTVESALDTFIRRYDSDKNTLSSGENSSALLLNNTFALKLSTDEETGEVDAIVITDDKGNATTSLPLHTVTKLEFEIVKESENDSALVICTVTYTRTSGSGQTTGTATICHAVRAMKTN